MSMAAGSRVPWRIYHLRSVESTNDLALRIARYCPEAHGAVVSADWQRAGRGREGRRWDCPRGRGILCSVLLRPCRELPDAMPFSLLAATAVCQAIGALIGVPGRAKWPNDVVIHGKKVAGVLVEASMQGGRVVSAVLGIGLNVNQRPAELIDEATSLYVEAGRIFLRRHAMHELLSSLRTLYEVFESEGPQGIADLWGRFRIE